MATADPNYMRIYLNKAKELKSLMTNDIKGAQPKRTTWERKENSDPWGGIPTYLSKSSGPGGIQASLPPISKNNSQLNNSQDTDGMGRVRPGAKNLDHLNRMMMNLPGNYQRLNEIIKTGLTSPQGNTRIGARSPYVDRNSGSLPKEGVRGMFGGESESQVRYNEKYLSRSEVKLPALGKGQHSLLKVAASQAKPQLPHLETSESLLVQGHLTKGTEGRAPSALRGKGGEEHSQERAVPPRYYLQGIFVKQPEPKPAGVVVDPQLQQLRFFGGRKGRPIYPHAPPPQHDRQLLLHAYDSAGLNVEPFMTKGQRYRRVSPDSQFIYNERAPQHMFDKVIDERIFSASKNIAEMRRTAIKEWEQFSQSRQVQQDAGNLEAGHHY